METWDIYDKYRNFTGKIVLRNDEHLLEDGDYGLVVHVAIFNSNNEMLIQKRQTTKTMYPNLWDISAGGHSISGETSEEAIERELFEEIGYQYDFSNQRPHFTINYDDGFGDVYIIHDEDTDINTLKLQYEEVQNIAWASKEEILQLIDEGKFIPYQNGFIELIFNMSNQRGVIKKKGLDS